MRAVCLVLVIAVAVVSADVKLGLYSKMKAVPYSSDVAVEETSGKKFSDSEEFVNVVDYLNENASGKDLFDLIESFNDAIDDLESKPGSIISLEKDIFQEIPWAKINEYVMSKLSENFKFAKVYAILNDPEFKDLLNKAVNSVALQNYAKSIEATGFKWTTFGSFALKAICDTAIVSHQDSYSQGVCKSLKDL